MLLNAKYVIQSTIDLLKMQYSALPINHLSYFCSDYKYFKSKRHNG